jgi:MinD-like ATPase involved in chromosome partitioning or flagellar assembly
LSRALRNKTNSKILVVDLDTLSGNIDELFDVNKIPQNIEVLIDLDKKCGLNYAADLIKKGRFDSNVFEEIIIHDSGIDILTGNTSLYYCQEVLCENIYNVILDAAKENYDFIILDTSSNIFLDSTRWCMQKATKIIFAIENNYLNIKKASQFLDVMVKTWGILKSKINLVINKENFNGLSIELIENILEDYKVLGKIKIGNSTEENAYNQILENIKFVPKISMKDRLINITNSIKSICDKKIITKKEVIGDVN